MRLYAIVPDSGMTLLKLFREEFFSVTSDVLNSLSASMKLQRLGASEDAGLCITSLPLPRGFESAGLGFAGAATYTKALGQHWNDAAPSPRRLLMIADSGGRAAPELNLSRTAAAGTHELPRAEAVLLAASEDPEVHWERHTLKLTWGTREIELALGMRVNGELRWWEYCRLIEITRGKTCVEIQMSGSIPYLLFNGDELRKHPGYSYPGIQKHHWLSGHIYARLHSNGVCEIYARHVNSRFVDDGVALQNAVPVVCIRAAAAAGDTVTPGAWNGTQTRVSLGEVAIDLSEPAQLVSERQPGNFSREEGFTIWQPYLGMELFGGIYPKELTGDPYIYHAEQQLIPRGMARTLRFSLSLNPQRSPRIARYLAPSWWYGIASEFTADPLLPVSDRFDESIHSCQKFIREHMVRNGFEDGSLPRGARTVFPLETGDKCEPGWEGEAAGSAYLLAYRTGEAQDYFDATRAAYCFNDVYVDHAAKIVRAHGYIPNALNVPMSRIHACVYAYLETGDRFCYDAGRAVIDTVYWTHKNSWPRVAVGRDACFVRGAMLFYRFFKDERALEIARDVIADVCTTQSADGWFGDQGGGSGIHGWAAYIAKPWMGLMAVGGLLDYLELFPDGDAAALACVKRFADWLMRERFDHDGVMGWSYQHAFNGKKEFRFAQTGKVTKLPTPGLWHMDYFARLMTFCSMRWNDQAYFDAWVESYDGTPRERMGDHSFAQTTQYVPWTQAKTWNVRLGADGKPIVDPLNVGVRCPARGVAMTPQGPLEIRRLPATAARAAVQSGQLK